MPTSEFLGPYRIGEMLGRGGMGNVYAAKHETSGQVVAVKLIAAHVADECRFRRRFEREIHALKLLKHPGIVRLIGYGEEEGQLFYSMELVEGETLQARIRREKKIGWRDAIDISIQICAALKHAHDIGVKHRDLKPANLMLTPDGLVKLVDFGIPKNFFDSSEETAVGSILGTPDYMAPEQAVGGEITGRTDLYALGSVMYAMLAGRSPFKGKNATAVIEAVKRDRPIPLTMLEDKMPDELAELIHHLLEKEPAKRPPTALVVMNRLKAMRAALSKEQTHLADRSKTKVNEQPSFPKSAPSSDQTGLTGLTGVVEVTGMDDGNPANPVDIEAINRSGPTDVNPRTVATRDSVADEQSSPAESMSLGVSSRSPAAPNQSPADDLTLESIVDRTEVSKVRRSAPAAKIAVPKSPSQSDDRTSASQPASAHQSSSAAVSRSDGSSSGSKSKPHWQEGIEGQSDEPTTRTSFETVEENVARPSLLAEHDASNWAPSKFATVASLIVMIVILAVGVFAFIYASVPPTADELYQTAIDEEDRGAAEAFLKRFPEDSRVDAVREMQSRSQLQSTLNRLTARSKIGLSPLDAAQASFLAAMQDRDTEPAKTAEALHQWLAAFGDADQGTAVFDLVELAKNEKRRLENANLQSHPDPRAASLIADIRKSIERGDDQVTRTKLTGIVQTFAEVEWAEPAIDEAQLWLENSDNATNQGFDENPDVMKLPDAITVPE